MQLIPSTSDILHSYICSISVFQGVYMHHALYVPVECTLLVRGALTVHMYIIAFSVAIDR